MSGIRCDECNEEMKYVGSTKERVETRKGYETRERQTYKCKNGHEREILV